MGYFISVPTTMSFQGAAKLASLNHSSYFFYKIKLQLLDDKIYLFWRYVPLITLDYLAVGTRCIVVLSLENSLILLVPALKSWNGCLRRWVVQYNTQTAAPMSERGPDDSYGTWLTFLLAMYGFWTIIRIFFCERA